MFKKMLAIVTLKHLYMVVGVGNLNMIRWLTWLSVEQGCGLGLDVSVSRRMNVSSRSRKANVSVSAINVSCPRPIFRQILQVTIIKLIKSVVFVNK